MDKNWIKRRWFDFRMGHNTYLIFSLTGANFILIFHRLFIERIPILAETFSNLWLFALVFLAAYVPCALAIGHWHRKTQLKIDNEQYVRQNLLQAKMFRIILDIQIGKASKEEIEEMRKMLMSIEGGKG
jgi:hypothetical protein